MADSVRVIAGVVSEDTLGVPESIGAVTMGKLDITTYVPLATGIPLTAGQLGLSKIFGFMAMSIEVVSRSCRPIIAANGLSVVLAIITTDTGLELGGVDAGEWNWIAWGERARETENLSV
jgi:hypothetical protein